VTPIIIQGRDILCFAFLSRFVMKILGVSNTDGEDHGSNMAVSLCYMAQDFLPILVINRSEVVDVSYMHHIPR